jgi:hypothetical protein
MATSFADVSSIGNDASVDTSVDDSALDGAVDTQTDDGSGSSSDDGSGGDQGSGDGSQQTTDRVDARRGPESMRAALKAASEAAPEQAAQLKALGASYFREQAYRKEFPTVAEATSAKQLIESVGGVDGVAALQQRDSQYQADDALLMAGDPAVFERFAKDAPEGFAALAPHYLEKLGSINPQALQAAVVPYAVGMLKNAGFVDTLKAIYNETDAAKAKQMVASVFNWFAQQEQQAGQMAQKPAKSPATDRIKQQETALQNERTQLFDSGVATVVNTAVNPEMTKTVDQYAKQYKLNPKQAEHFKQTLQQRVIQEMGNDKVYGQQVAIRRANKTRTHQSVGSYIASEFNRRLTTAAHAVATEIYGAPRGSSAGTPKPGSGVVKADAPKTAPNGGPVRVTTRPSEDAIDHNKTSTIDLISGRARLKNGRYVTWMPV